ncbi:MAG: hypothetical protein RLZZ175_1039 [Bacteroidota bacterium]|jgi:hypothetical protein
MSNFELIEQYLNNELSAEEKAVFEQSLTQNEDLKSDFEFHQNLRKAIENEAYKSVIQQSTNNYKNWIKFKSGLIFAAIITLFVVAVVVLSYRKLDDKSKEKSEDSGVKIESPTQIQKATSEIGEIIKSILPKPILDLFEKENVIDKIGTITPVEENIWAEKYLPKQDFLIDNQKDTIIETENGLVFFIPGNTSVDENSNPIKGTITYQIQEAFTPADIILAGLDTRSNGSTLETGGMFKINAFQNGTELKIDNNKAITVDVPQINENTKDFKIYDGEVKNGNINWINPKDLNNYLTPIDMSLLNFLPPNFEITAQNQGLTCNKTILDSIYFSFAIDTNRFKIFYHNFDYRNENSNKFKLIYKKYLDLCEKNKNEKTELNFHIYKKENGEFAYEAGIISKPNFSKFINPSSIKSFWSKDYNNTIFATKEFEERMQYIFTTCNPQLVKLYIDNIDKNLWEIDEMASNICTVEVEKQKFKAFASLKHTKIKNSNSEQIQALKMYYDKRYAIIMNELKQNALAEQKRIEEFNKAKKQQNDAENAKISDMLRQEIAQNTYQIAKQQGLNPNIPIFKKIRENAKKQKDRLSFNISLSKNVKYKPKTISVAISSFGWKNIDKLTSERNTFSITQNGKTGTIIYNPFKMIVNRINQFDRTLAYLLPNELNSFMRMKNQDSIFTEKLNANFKYNSLIIGFKDEKQYFFEKSVSDSVIPNIKLNYITKDDLTNFLNQKYHKQAQLDLNQDINYQILDLNYQKKYKDYYKINEVKGFLKKDVFPCDIYDNDVEKRGPIQF